MSNKRADRMLRYDRVIDIAYGEYQLGGGAYSASELLHAIDPDAYEELALRLIFEQRRPTSAA